MISEGGEQNASRDVPGVSDGPARADRWAAPAWLDRAAGVGARLLVLAVLVWLVAELVTRLTLLLVAVFVALLLAGVFSPVVRWASGKGVRDWISAGAAVLVLLVVLTGASLLIGERIADQLPQLQDQLQEAADELSPTLGIDVPSLGSTGGGTQGGSDGDSSDGGQGSGSQVASGALSSLGVVADVLIGLFLALAFMFLFLKNGRAMWEWGLSKLGGRLREDVDAAGRAAWGTLGAYVRGLTVVALFDAIGIGLGLLLLGVPLALTLAALQFVASYVPTVGSIAAGAVAAVVGYVSGGAGTAALVVALALVVQQIGNNVIEPYVMERELPINAFMVLVAVTAGGLLWGIAGALLFVPLLAASSAAGHELWVRHGSRPLAGG